jgi:diguanylate cyclase (GGDEF)-like protein/PAS domain S-box-containing protein
MPALSLDDLREKVKTAALPLLVFCAGIVITCLLVLSIQRHEDAEKLGLFNRITALITTQTETRLRAHLATLLSAKGLFAVSERLDRRQWRDFLEPQELQRNHPGFKAIQFVRYVPDAKLANFIETVRRDYSIQSGGYPDFDVKPRSSRPDHYVIEYTEPMEGNEAAFGLDVDSKPQELEALQLARDNGKPVATARLKLVQDATGQAPAFVLSLPLYRTGVPSNTIEQRRAALIGFAAAVYDMNDLMRSVIGQQLAPHLRVRIYDTGYAHNTSAGRQETLLFDSKDIASNTVPAVELAELTIRRTLTVGERSWVVHFVALDGERFSSDHTFAASVALAGATISCLVAVALVGLARLRALSSRLSDALGEQLSILDHATVGIEFLKNRHVQSCNRGLEEMLGYSAGELSGTSTRIRFPSQEAYEEMGKVYDTLHEGRSWIGDVELQRKDGQRIWCRLHAKEVDPSQPERGSIWVSYEITTQKRTDAALQEANTFLGQSLAQIERSHREFTLLSEFSSFLQACPTLADAFSCIGQFAPRLFPESAGALYLMGTDKACLERHACWGDSPLAIAHFPTSECWAMRRGQTNRTEANKEAMCCPHLQSESANDAAATLCLPLMAQASTFGLLYLEHHQPESDSHGDLRYHLAKAWAEDIGLALANLHLRDTLRQQSIRDPLTGLFNRRHLNDVIERELARAARSGALVALAVVDVDHFKRVNDNYGHDTGDVVLKAVARAIAGQVRESDIVCRFGGEEFVVVMAEITADAARVRAEQIRLAIGQLDCRHGEHVVGTVTASLGLALYPQDGADEAALVHAADAALYRAKEGGRNRVVLSGDRMDAAAAA